MGRKTSIVWNHFTIPELYPKKALCNYCHQLVCRGQANLGTTSLMNHLKRCNEFKAAILGLPKGVNDMVADIMAQESQSSINMQSRENNEEIVHVEPQAVSDDENSTPALPENSIPMPRVNPPQLNSFYRRISNSPSLVGRHNWTPSTTSRESITPVTQSYQNQKSNRRSMLLYGDISSTSEEEPSSSNTCYPENPLLTSSSNDLNNYITSESTVNFVHGGIVLHMLYEQYKTGKFCDLHIIPQRAVNEATILESGKISHKNISSEKKMPKISVHSCLLTAMSKKIDTLVDMGCTCVKLRKGSSEAVRGVMEIVYTGKLDKIRTYTEAQLTEIIDVARFLEVDLAVQYLMREIPESKTRQKPKHIAQRELYNEAMLAFSHIQKGWTNLPNPVAVPGINPNVTNTPIFNEALFALQRDEMRREQESQDGTLSNSASTSDNENNDSGVLKHTLFKSRPIARLIPKTSKGDNSQQMNELIERVSEEVLAKRPKLDSATDEHLNPESSSPTADGDVFQEDNQSSFQEASEPPIKSESSELNGKFLEQSEQPSNQPGSSDYIMHYKFHPLQTPGNQNS